MWPPRRLATRCLTPAWTDNGIRTAASADQRWTAQWVYNTAETLMTFFVACSDPNFEWVGLGISTSGTNACSRPRSLSRPLPTPAPAPLSPRQLMCTRLPVVCSQTASGGMADSDFYVGFIPAAGGAASVSDRVRRGTSEWGGSCVWVHKKGAYVRCMAKGRTACTHACLQRLRAFIGS